MSKSLKKLIDINRLREFKNKLVGTDSAYVQTGAVDQTVAGTKTFSKPIVGSVTGSSGSCTGNAATATRADSAANADTATNATNSGYTNWLRTSSHTDHLFHTEWDGSYFWTYVTAGDGGYRAVRVERSNSSGYADSAGSANTANSAATATTAQACTGNAATATKAVSADSATNASHATSADKATKAEQDGNGNNIVASYVAAGSDDSTTDIGAFMAARPSFIKSFTYNNVWTDAISMRHRNGSGDGPAYGTYIRSSNMTSVSNLLWNHQFGGTWQGERTLIDSANLAGFILSMVYPVGSVYISVNDVSPATFLGGTWEKISQGRVLQGAANGQAAGTAVEAGLPNISVSSDGAHTHTRGSMNITGSVGMHAINGCTPVYGMDGAFYGSRTGSTFHAPECISGATSEHFIDFSADRAWTGSTSSDGAHSHNAYITGITGNSTTVQPPALLVNIWKRTA